MPLPNILEFVGTNVTQTGFKIAQEKLLDYVGKEVPTKIYVDELSLKSNKGVKNFATEALLKAYVPTVEETGMFAYAWDVKNTFEWKNGAWEILGPSELELAKYYTDDLERKSEIKASSIVEINEQENIYFGENDLIGFFVGAPASAIPGKIGVNASTRMHKLNIEEGESYLFFGNFNALNISIAFSNDDVVLVGNNIVYAEIEVLEINLIRVLVPKGFKYLLFNTKVNSFDVSASLIVNKFNGEYYKFGNAEISDEKARKKLFELDSEVIKRQDLTTTESFPNLAVNEVLNSYVTVPSSTDLEGGKIRILAGTALQLIEVESGKTYAIWSSSFNKTRFGCAAYHTNIITDKMQATYLTFVDTEDPNVKLVTIPEGLSFLYASTLIPTINFDIREGFWINEGDYSTKQQKNYISQINDFHLYDEEAHEKIDQLSGFSRLQGKKWIAIGDSITEKNFRANLNYHDYIKEDVGGMTVYNKGISGSGFHDRMNVADTLTEQADYITLFWGTNDFGLVRNTYPLGEFLSTDIETISGRINTCLSALITKYPLAKIAIISALPRLTNYGSNAAPNSVGYTLKQHVDLLEKYAEHYSLPFLNLYKQSNLPVWISAANQHYFTAPSLTAPDGLHPNDAGHRVMADKIKVFLESL